MTYQYKIFHNVKCQTKRRLLEEQCYRFGILIYFFFKYE